MDSSTSPSIEAWEDEGGFTGATSLSAGPRACPAAPTMAGSEAQVEWAGRIRSLVDAEFDRVAATFRMIAGRQADGARAETEAVIAILEDKRAEVMARKQAGYFIHDWQEIGDQVRQMIFRDPRFQAIKSNRKKRLNGIMNIRPLYDRIVVKRIAEQETTRSGIIIPDSAKEKPQEGEVMAVGHGKRLEDGKLTPLNVKAGDRILFGKYSGSEITLDGVEYIIMREDDVLGLLDAAAPATATPPAA
jgi:chaperonin GroES